MISSVRQGAQEVRCWSVFDEEEADASLEVTYKRKKEEEDYSTASIGKFTARKVCEDWSTDKQRRSFYTSTTSTHGDRSSSWARRPTDVQSRSKSGHPRSVERNRLNGSNHPDRKSPVRGSVDSNSSSLSAGCPWRSTSMLKQHTATFQSRKRWFWQLPHSWWPFGEEHVSQGFHLSQMSPFW